MFAGQTVVITGATGALGSALVRNLVDKKAVVVALDRDAAGLALLGEEVEKSGAEFHAIKCDLLNRDEVSWALNTIAERFPRVDIWINNAGVTTIGSFLEQSEENWERVVELNFLSVVRLTRHALRMMQKQGKGTIVNLASVAGAVPAAWMTAYTASKHAVVGFTRALQEELRQQTQSVELVLVTPGFFESQLIVSERASFPEWLRPILGTPKAVARDVLAAIQSGRRETTPTLNGKVLLRLYKTFPRMVTRSSMVLLTRRPLDILLNRYEVPKG